MSREYVLKGYIETVRKNYDYILIDCMPSLGMMTINALVAADSVIIPSQPSFLSTKGLNLLLHSVSKVKRSINPGLKIDGILLTMVDSRTNNARDIIEALRAGIGQNIRVFETEIPHSVRAAECSLAGLKPITIHGLRHSHVSLLISKRYDIFEVSKRIGHKSVKTTQDTYGHLFDEVQKSIANDLDGMRRR